MPPETPTAAALLQDVRGFLAGLRQELPEVFRRMPLRPGPPPAPERPSRGKDDVRELFEARVKHWSAAMGVSPRRVFLKNQRTLWGSCSTRGNLNFNRVLGQAPAEVLDYVVIHELAHLKEMNHSRRFWAVVEGFCPEQKERRRWLRRNVALLRGRGPIC
ncbi:MAG: M48 family metallopeptidase [Elusimicrobia bacterium]|nr:M48 family metallopeptidase [Elusimicrobiota bacterium]